jgi:L-iditol 2-dehydrogenase
MGAHRMNLELTSAAAREVDIIGSFRYANTFPLCLELMASKRIDVMPLITHRFGWSAAQLDAGFQTAINQEHTHAIKVMFCGLANNAPLT